jgi:hypothetical protein
MASPVEDPHQTTFDDLGVLINFFVFWNYHFPSPHISVPSLVNQILSHACVDDNVACEISHFLASGKDFMTKYLNYLTVAPVV